MRTWQDLNDVDRTHKCRITSVSFRWGFSNSMYLSDVRCIHAVKRFSRLFEVFKMVWAWHVYIYIYTITIICSQFCFSYILWACENCITYVYACGPKTVPVKRTFLNIAIVGWSGVGWGGMLTFLVLRTWYIAMLLRSLGSFTTLHVATLLMGWGGVGVGCGGGHVNVPCTSCMIYCHAAEIFGIVYYVTCCYAAEISGIVYYVTCCYAAEISGIVYYVTIFYMESDEKVNSQQLECQKWPLDGVC